jgi:Uma2 family endonuclease
MSQAAVAPPTFEELYAEIQALPEGMTGEILEPGVLRTMSRPGRAHRWAAQRCFARLDGFDVRNSGVGWWIEFEAEIKFLRDRLAVPDIAGWRVERVPELPEENPITIVPDFCCEILSPTTARDDRSVKLPLYARAGVAWVWLIDPALRLIEIFETVNGRPALVDTARDDDAKQLPPFEGEIAVGPWWPPAPAGAR